MKVHQFDTQKGIYEFELSDFNTENHSHPTVEVILAQQGSFSLWVKDEKYTDVLFAIIDKNIPHRIEVSGSEVRILMLESFNSLLTDLLVQYQIHFENTVFISKEKSSLHFIFETIQSFSIQQNLRQTSDWRVEKCLEYFEQSQVDYRTMMDSLTQQTHLSESRISHVFKEYIGISLKKYLVWSRLKRTMQLFLNDNINLYHAGLQSGFYDQAHLSKVFKKVFGISPSDEYNSRIIQS